MKVCSIFSQVLKLFSRGGFEKAVKQHKAERHARGFTSWGQFMAMLFCQVGRAHSLREICGGLACCEGHLKHLGVPVAPKRSTLAYANEHRPWELYQTVFEQTLLKCQELVRSQGGRKKFRFKNKLMSFPRLAREGEKPVLFRRVEILDKEKEETIVFLSNLLAFGATTIAAIYKDRWQVELFFKALKQTLKIKTFVGTSANAVRTQVWTALIAMLVLKYLQLKSKFSWSLSTLAALLRQQLFFYRDLWVWLDDPFQAPPALAGVHDDAQQLQITW